MNPVVVGLLTFSAICFNVAFLLRVELRRRQKELAAARALIKTVGLDMKTEWNGSRLNVSVDHVDQQEVKAS